MDINKFGPFQAEVWGTVSDWFIVVITIITGIFIWRTLKSQITTQQFQGILTEIEKQRHRVEILPQFKLSVKHGKIDTSTKVNFEINDIVITLTLNNNVAKDVRVVINADSNWTFEKKDYYNNMLNGGSTINFRCSHRMPFFVFGSSVVYLPLTVYYSDITGINKYEQRHSSILAFVDEYEPTSMVPQLLL